METPYKAVIALIFVSLCLGARADPITDAFSAVSQGQKELSEGNSSKAAASFRRALRLFPGWYRPMLGLAAASIQSGNLKAGLKWLDKAIHREPNRWDTQLIAGRVMEAANRPKKAMRHYIKAFPLSLAHREVIRDYACALGARIPQVKRMQGYEKFECGDKNNGKARK